MTPPKTHSCEKFLRKTQEKKEILRNPVRNGFLDPKNKFLKTGICNLGLPAVDRTWRAWKVAFRLAHLKRQRQIQASGGGELLRGANAVLPAPAVTIDRLGTAALGGFG